MKHLFLIRHAKSSWDDERLSDCERPLNPRGERQLGPLAKALQQLDAVSGEVYASPAKRAQQTAKGMLVPGFRTDAELYTFDYRRLLEWLKRLPDNQDHVAIVGHNPALLELAAWLTKHAPLELPTASLVHLRLPVKRWRKLAKGSGTLETVLTPRDYSYVEFARKNSPADGLLEPTSLSNLPDTLRHHAARLKQLERGVALGLDEEFLHQYRIALRRSRALAEAIAEVTGDSALRPAIAQLKRHAKATSTLRDLHVFLMELPSVCPENPELRASLQAWASMKAGKRQKRLAERLATSRYHRSMHSWETEIDSGKFRKRIAGLSKEAIRKAIGKRLRSFNRSTAELLHTAPDEDFHRLRKQLKRIRYLLELDSRAKKSDLKALRQRQDLYGRFQDLHMQIELLELFRKEAPETLPEAVAGVVQDLETQKAHVRRQILAMGGLDIGHLR